MENDLYEVEAFRPFSKSLIWQLNRDFYQTAGIEAWSEGVVPHHMTSNSLVGKNLCRTDPGFSKRPGNKGGN